MKIYFRSGETASCTLVFILVYYFLMAALTWFVILTYAWHLTFRVLGTPRDLIQGKRGHFHLVAWSGPLVLTIVCLALTQVHTPRYQVLLWSNELLPGSPRVQGAYIWKFSISR